MFRPLFTYAAILFLLCAMILPARAVAQAPGGTVSTFAGTGMKGLSGDGGPATAALLNNVFAVARGLDGALYVCDTDNHRVRRVLPDGTIETYAGTTKGYSGDGGPAIAAQLNEPYELAWDKDANLYIVERMNHCIRRIDAKTGIITTIAGTGVKGFSGDGGPAEKAQMDQPHSIAFGPGGDLFVCDILNHRVRKIDLQSGMISTWSGTGEKKISADGTKIGEASMHGPRAIAFTPDGKCWLALREGNALLLLDPKEGTLKRMAGTGRSGFTGNGGPALQATLAGPKCVALDASGNVYLADTESHSIRYLDVGNGTIEVLVGDGMKGDGPDGDPLKCRLGRPHGVFVDKDGAIFIGDSENHRVRVWRAAGR
jgi:DNA-binding beta-propeller fold protein YncE